MNDFQNELLEIRKKIINKLRSDLMGPGSEISYPDAEHELISEYPAERYSVGILYPQEQKYGDNDDEDNGNDKTVMEQKDVDFPEQDEDETGESRYRMHKDDDTLDDEINLAQQNKPSSMGLTFFVSKNLNSIKISVDYAEYIRINDSDIEIPYSEKDLYIHDCLKPYITFDKDRKVIKKGQPIYKKHLDEVFEGNAIEDPELYGIIVNINGVFKSGKSYRRCPFNETIDLEFDGDIARSKLENANGTITAVKHRVEDDIYSITIMMVNNNTDRNGHIFQPKVKVNSNDLQGAIFVSYNNQSTSSTLLDEEKSLDLLYRNKLVYGTGHGVSADWNIDKGKGEIRTEFMPIYEVPKINLDLRRETEQEKAVQDRSLSMKYLSDLDDTDKAKKVGDMNGFIDCYDAWINELQKECDQMIPRYHDIAQKHIDLCRESYNRMKNGLDILRADATVWNAFQLTNRAMFMQRIHGAYQKKDIYPDDETWQQEMANLNYKSFGENIHRWRPFQLAFLLMSVNSIVNPECEERDLVDLIWFPTGGGKTEAYLGLTAFTIFHRRLLNPTNGGTTVMMRYTLRLLTSQQFTRAATLICACEKIRRDEEDIGFKNYNLGQEKITIGLWIGGDHVPNTNDGEKGAKYYLRELTANTGDLKGRKDKYNKFQVLKCPWCGTKLVKDQKDGKDVGKWGYKLHNKKSFYLSCTQENCEFEGELPIQIIDEELYKNPPTLLFGTVDKFAMMAWKHDIKAFFGKQNNDAPDLIIQDELHLISGPLGSMVGLYETAIDYLCSYKGRRPKVIASTATIRHADEQCRALYNREVRQFPSPGLDASDSFFAKEIPTEVDFGRSYLGIMPSGKTKVMLLARAAAMVLQYVHLLECTDELKDQFYTLAIYFNSLKELGKASSVVADDVKDFIKRSTYRQVVKHVTARTIGMAYELTSRVSTSELNDTLDRLENASYSKDKANYPISVLLASNMISVGVDVSRLNLMFLQGQPKSVSEYIQASSRIGRTNPGVAVTLYDASKSRDRSYYEQFRAFHSAFYKYVEPTGVTPFSAPARDRALHAAFLSCIRQSVEALNPDVAAENILENINSEKVDEIAKYIYERVKEINTYNPEGMEDDSDQVMEQLTAFINEWNEKAEERNLIYGEKHIASDAPKGTNRLIKRFDDKNQDDAQRTLTSLRSVDKTVPVSVLIWED